MLDASHFLLSFSYRCGFWLYFVVSIWESSFHSFNLVSPSWFSTSIHFFAHVFVFLVALIFAKYLCSFMLNILSFLKDFVRVVWLYWNGMNNLFEQLQSLFQKQHFDGKQDKRNREAKPAALLYQIMLHCIIGWWWRSHIMLMDFRWNGAARFILSGFKPDLLKLIIELFEAWSLLCFNIPTGKHPFINLLWTMVWWWHSISSNHFLDHFSIGHAKIGYLLQSSWSC